MIHGWIQKISSVRVLTTNRAQRLAACVSASSQSLRFYFESETVLKFYSLEACLFSHQRILQSIIRTSLEKKWTQLSSCFSRGSVPVLLIRHIATSDLTCGEGGLDPLPPYGSAHVIYKLFRYIPLFSQCSSSITFTNTSSIVESFIP